MLAPVLAGGGVSSKVFLALQHGMPVVTTPLGMRGLRLPRGQSILTVKKWSTDFARAASQLHDNATLWNRQRTRALRHAERELGVGRLLRALRAALSTVVSRACSSWWCRMADEEGTT